MSFSLFMLSFAKPDQLYQVIECFYFTPWSWRQFRLFPLSSLAADFPRTGNRFWVSWWHDVPSKRCCAFALFQEETNFGYDFRLSWIGSWCCDSSDHDKQFIFFRSWVQSYDANQRRHDNFCASDSLLVNASPPSPPSKRPPIMNSIRKLYNDWPYVALTFG